MDRIVFDLGLDGIHEVSVSAEFGHKEIRLTFYRETSEGLEQKDTYRLNPNKATRLALALGNCVTQAQGGTR